MRILTPLWLNGPYSIKRKTPLVQSQQGFVGLDDTCRGRDRQCRPPLFQFHLGSLGHARPLHGGLALRLRLATLRLSRFFGLSRPPGSRSLAVSRGSFGSCLGGILCLNRFSGSGSFTGCFLAPLWVRPSLHFLAVLTGLACHCLLCLGFRAGFCGHLSVNSRLPGWTYLIRNSAAELLEFFL